VSVRVRFAPSPTGELHLGNARTAVLNWLVARQAGGSLIVRIEDTDRSRNVAGAEARILHDLRWLGLDWDEGPDGGGDRGPYRQSERSDSYEHCLQRLLESGRAYRDGAAVRFRVPDRDVYFDDVLRGSTGVRAGEIEDFVIGRSDGSPTYQLAVVADDHAMGVTTVLRGQDHLTNTPRQLLLYEALDWEPPRFAHLPLVLGADRSRLSKRHGATSVAHVREAGILPEALLNYLVLLGWGPPQEQEVFAVAELFASWRLDAVSAANAVFDLDKLDWLNRQHLARLTPEQILERTVPFLHEAGLAGPSTALQEAWYRDALDLVRSSAHRLEELPGLLQAAFVAPSGPVEDAREPATRTALELFAQAAAAGRLRSPEDFRAVAREVSGQTGLRGRALFHPLRLATTGQEAGPELGKLMPLMDAGARAGLQPPVLDVASRLRAALG